MGRIHFRSAPGVRFAGVIHGIFESTGIIGVCAAIRHHIPNLRTIPGLKTHPREGIYPVVSVSVRFQSPRRLRMPVQSNRTP
jgi:hypothetical protein